MAKAFVFTFVLLLTLIRVAQAPGEKMDLEGSYQLDRKTGQIIIELTLTAGDTADFEDVAVAASKGIVNCQVQFQRRQKDYSEPSRLKVTLGLLPVDEPEFNEGPSKEELTAEFAALPDKSL